MAGQAAAIHGLKSSHSFVSRAWKTDEGLPHNSVMAVTQTRDGYVWIGTANGLARFDGVEFKRFGLSDGLSGLYVRVLLEDRKGGLWIGTVNGLSRYFEGHFTTWTTRKGLAGNVILGLAEDRNGAIWIATNTGLTRWREGGFETITQNTDMSGRYIAAVTVDHDNRVWASVSGIGLMRGNENAFESLARPLPESVSRLFCDRTGSVWAGNDIHVYRLENGNWKQYGAEEGLPEVRITSLSEGRDGTIWVGTVDEGVFYLHDGKFKRIAQADGLSDNAILAAIEDRDANIWVGTRAGGLNRLKARQVLTPSHVEDGVEVLPMSLAQSSDGSLWIASLGRGIYRLNPELQQYSRVSLPNLPASLPLGALLIGRDESIWWGSGTLSHWTAGELMHSYAHLPPLRGDAARCLLEDKDNGTWIGTRDGRLFRLRAGTFTTFTNGLPRESVTSLAQQSDGTLWVGSYGGGVARLKDGVATAFNSTQGLGSDLVRALCVDSRNNVWIGTEGGGLSCFKDGAIRTFGIQHGVGDDSVVQILEDDARNLWLGTFRGIFQLLRADLDALLAGRVARVYPRKFDRSDGMLSQQCIASFGAALKTKDGRLCFSTDRGVVVIDPKRNFEKASRPVVRLEKLLLQDVPQSLERKTELEIPPRQGRFEFQYTALYFAAPDRVRFRYRLHGWDEEWIEAGARRSAYYNHLPPGRYRFEVAAHSGDGIWSESDASVALVVLPHFTETWWFQLSGWLAGVSAASAGVVLTVRRRNTVRFEAMERQRAMERERARIAQDLHDDLGANLTQIRFLGAVAARSTTPAADVPRYIEQMRRGAREMVIALDEIVWAVNPKNDSLRALVSYMCHYAEEFISPTGIRCRLDMSDDLPEKVLASDVRHHLFLAFKEALNNAVRHSTATEVQIQLRLNEKGGELVVRDDGCGFDSSADGSSGNGLGNMRSRLQAAGGQCTIESRPEQGTVISFQFPLT